MSAFDQQFADGQSLMHTHLDDAIVYTTPKGESTSITAETGTPQVTHEDRDGQRQRVITRELTLDIDPQSDTYCGVIDANEKGRMTIGGDEYAIVYRRVAGPTCLEIQLRRVELIQQTQRSYY